MCRSAARGAQERGRPLPQEEGIAQVGTTTIMFNLIVRAVHIPHAGQLRALCIALGLAAFVLLLAGIVRRWRDGQWRRQINPWSGDADATPWRQGGQYRLLALARNISIPPFQRPVYQGMAAIMLLLIASVLLLHSHPTPHGTRSVTPAGRSMPHTKPAFEVGPPTFSAVDPWLGQAPPTPRPLWLMTPAYRHWRVTLEQAIARLAGRKTTRGTALALRQWVTRVEAQARGGQLPSTSVPLFSQSAVRALLPPPPNPAFTLALGFKVVLPWNGASYTYAANPVPAGHPYLLHPDGVDDGGTPLRRHPNLVELFAQAGVRDAVARNVLIDVSGLEGGFDAVNTWDTGYVSIGFIQFITGETGEGHSLVQVLGRMKEQGELYARRHPGHHSDFATFFTDHGIDVRDGMLWVRDPQTGSTHTGAEAVQLIIRDKRVTAIFQDAGVRSTAFQVAQIREAYGAYYLARQPFRIPVVAIREYHAAVSSVSACSTPTALASPSAPPGMTYTTQYVYGEAAVRLAMAQTSRGSARTGGAGVSREIIRQPDLVGYYGDVLATEHGRLVLTDRAVQHGVQNATDTFALAVNTLPQDGTPFTVSSLRAREGALQQLLANRVTAQAGAETPGAP